MTGVDPGCERHSVRGSRRTGAEGDEVGATSDGANVAPATAVEHFRRRVLVDALQEATRDYWLRRAAQFAAVGNASCDEVAANCRIHAELMADHVVDVAALLEEVA